MINQIIGNRRWKKCLSLLLLVMALFVCAAPALADSLSADNSLSSLGIMTEGATVSPDFAYGTTEYNITVPAGTAELSLDPTPTNSAAYIDSVSGTELTDGSTTVTITVVAENGDAYSYYLYVTEEAAAETEVQTETQTQTEEETEAETEDPRYVSVARETLEEAESTITALKSETVYYRDRVDLMMKILYGMIGLCVVLLFVVINLLLKNKDMKSELNTYRGLDYSSDQRGQEKQREKTPRQKKRKKKKAQKQAVEEDTQQPAANEAENSTFESDEFDRTGRDTFYELDKQLEKSVKPEMTDDPTTVPRPSRAKKQTKQMPEYEPQREKVRYEPSKEARTDSENVDVDFIDL